MIMNIESFNISKNVLYKLINKINPVRFRAIAGGLALLSILALPGCSLLEPEKMPPKPANPTGVSGKHDPQAEQLFAKAHVLWKGETCTDPEKALEYLDEALKIEPDYPQALIRRGLALSQLGYADDAFDDLTKAIRIEPSAEAYLSRGICLLQQGNTAGARKDLEEALRRDDRSYRVWNILPSKRARSKRPARPSKRPAPPAIALALKPPAAKKSANSRRLPARPCFSAVFLT